MFFDDNENSINEEKSKINYDELDYELLDKLKRGEINVEETVKNLEKLYKDELLDYSEKHCPSNDLIFAQCYHQLVHSSSLQEILDKEQNYAPKISKLMNRMEKQLSDMNEMHLEVMDSKINNLDVDGTTSDDINELLKQQYSSTNLIRKQYESELEATRGHQKNEFREYVTAKIGQKLLDSPQTSIGNKSAMFPNVNINRNADRREESFTIHLGSQLKSTHNIRILAADLVELCGPIINENNELVINGNIQLGIYSSSLSGVVCLVPSSSQIIANQKIIRSANLSTEFHFDQIDAQLEKIQNDLKESGESRLRPGDFFITKHSNLQCHLIFHLVYDDSSADMNSRHPCILGLRNILKIANRYDITQLTIPALLKTEMSEEMTLSWCLRRAELVLKCTKGFMIENSTGSELSTLQLLLPADISDELFMSISQMIPQIFRVANTKFL
ncbi:hypothetical protein PVAND_000007 [Polypedilum vanderplanki]|uniref:Macro domain-containing protein n=1 Tax=Polypedilum vanderplanki TaxID=319348 RepID=A0A9J6BJG9_POLVA|nr:hypothetical protein PVAND_000007 [Polypedilum vanderplanki]